MQTTPLLRAFGAALALGVAALGATPAQAAAPMLKKSAPGYYRIMLGDFEVTALSDGTFKAPVDKLMLHTTPAEVDAALAKDFLSNPIDMSITGYLVNTGSKLVLIDTGLGKFDKGLGPGAHHLLANLKASGYKPEQVDEVYITHLHVDHAGGLLENGKAAYPKAIVRVDAADAAQWVAKDSAEKLPEGFRFMAAEDQEALAPYIKAGHFKTFDGATELVPGISSVPTPGHTKGHTVYAVESKGQKLLIIGDLLHLPAMQFDNPDITIGFDSDDQAAAAQRKLIFADAAAKGTLIGAAHISFPGLGHIRAEGKGYVWVPVNYAPIY